MSDKPLFEFQLKAVPQDPSGYYYPRWDLAESVIVSALNFEEATEIAANALGSNSKRWPWAFRCKQITQVRGES